MKTDYWRNMFSKRKDEGSSKNDCLSHKNGILPPAVVQASREEIKKFLRGKRVGNYLLGKTVGSGSFARVKQGLHILTGEKVAVKIIDKKLAQEDPYVAKNMRREARLLQMARHPNIIKLLEVVETEHRYYLVTEVALGGDLMDYICYRKRLGEREVRKFMRQVVSAVHYLHQAGIIHRDLKIENLLMDEKFNIKIIDFGLSNILQRDHSDKRSRMEHCQTQCGSPAYAAPEILGHKPYGLEADVWSIGVNMFAMLTGKLPFTAEPFHITTLYNKMKNNEINPLPETVSSDCKDLVWRFLTFDPKKRIKLDEAMQHEWITKGSEEPFLPVPFPNYLREHQLNHNIIRHMVEKMNLKRATVVGALIQNRATPESTIYHLLQERLERYLQGQTNQGQSNRRSLHEELLPIDSLQAKALSTNKGSAVTNDKVLEELDTSLERATCVASEEHGNESVVDGIKAEEKLTENTGNLENEERVVKIDEARILVDPRVTLESIEKVKEDQNENNIKMEEEKLGQNEKTDNVLERRGSTASATQDKPFCEKIDSTQVCSDVLEPSDNPDLSSTQSFSKPNYNAKIISSFKQSNASSNISVSSLRTSSRDCAAQMSITISSAKSLDSQAMIDEKTYQEKDIALGEDSTYSLPKRRKSSARSQERKSFPSKIPAIKGVPPTRAKIISMPLSSTMINEEKEKVSETRRSPLHLHESVRVPTSRQRDKTPLSLSFTAMVERIAAKANKLKSEEEATTSRRRSKTAREDSQMGSSEESPVTLRQSGYGMYYQVSDAMKTDNVKEPTPISTETNKVTGQNSLHNIEGPEVEPTRAEIELTRPEMVLRPPSPKPVSTDTDKMTGKNSLHNLVEPEIEPTKAEVQTTQPEVILRPSSPRPPSSHRYTIPVVQGKDLYKIIIGSTITQVPTTRVRTKAVPRSQSKIPLPISEVSDKEFVKEGTRETHNTDQLFKLPISLSRSKRFSLEHARDLKKQEPPNLISNVVLTYHTKTPAIQPLPLSPQDKNLKSLECLKKSSSNSNETCGGGEIVRRRLLRRNCKEKQDEIKDHRRTVHIMNGESAKLAQEKVSNPVNAERSNDSSTANSQTIDETRTRVRIRSRPRSWVEPSTNHKNTITSSKISIFKFTHRRS